MTLLLILTYFKGPIRHVYQLGTLKYGAPKNVVFIKYAHNSFNHENLCDDHRVIEIIPAIEKVKLKH